MRIFKDLFGKSGDNDDEYNRHILGKRPGNYREDRPEKLQAHKMLPDKSCPSCTSTTSECAGMAETPVKNRIRHTHCTRCGISINRSSTCCTECGFRL